MTPSEINIEVAKRLGWVYVAPGETTETGYWKRDAVRDEGGRVMRPADFPIIPSYVSDIGAAWEIVDQFPAMGLFRTREGHWFCVPNFCLREDEKDEWYFKAENKDGSADTLADTAPMAICLAFLKLK